MALLTNGHEFEQTQGNSERQRSMVCCSSWGAKNRRDSVNEHQQLKWGKSKNLKKFKSNDKENRNLKI